MLALKKKAKPSTAVVLHGKPYPENLASAQHTSKTTRFDLITEKLIVLTLISRAGADLGGAIGAIAPPKNLRK